jgi:hypothetical protein
MRKINLSGTWKLNVIVGDQNGVATFQLVEGEDGTLSGTYTGRVGSSAKVSGIVKGPDVEFGFDWHAGNVTYKGRYSSGKLSGTCSYGTVGEGTFEGGKAEG